MLRVDSLSYTVRDSVLFENVSFVLDSPPKIITITGPSGSGKTTLLKLIALLIPPSPDSPGSILLNGHPPQHYGIPQYRSLVLYVPQRPPILPSTPKTFISSLCNFTSTKKSTSESELLSKCISIGKTWRLQEDVWDKNWNELSGGEIQRVSLAIAVARSPLVLLLDEPTSALDPATTLLVEKTLKKFNCVWITHSMDQENRISDFSIRMGTELA
ncbi:hypothetical protein HK098_001094 [Nowakowskiella sp. JEL0407]|nr:hypothetical protein HK098_001094 [Nowakowskiella sp. JEL0407]